MPGLSGGVRTTLRFVFIAFSIEILGALLLSLRFVPGYGWGKGLYYGVYHAVSAFCNAGFDLFGQAGSLQGFRGDFLVLLTVSFLIMLGGLGFTVIADISDHWRRPRRMSLHSKIVLVTNGLLLLFGLCFFAAMEWDNGLTLAREGAGPGEKLLNAWFQSVTSRTAGFYSFSQSAMRDASKLVTTVLMFIGASPASTGGGVKTSTFFVGWVVLLSIAAGREDNNAFGKRLSPAIGRTAQSILFIYLTLIVLGGICSVIEQRSDIAAIDLLFEEVSARAPWG